MNILDFHEAIEKDSEILELFEKLSNEALSASEEEWGAYDELESELDDVRAKFFSARRELYMKELADMDDDEFIRVFLG